MNKAKTWTDNEIEIIKNKFSSSTKEELIQLLQPRSYKSICGKAERLGIKKSGKLAVNYWTEEEEEVIKLNYPYYDEDDFKDLLPYRKWSEIQNKASKMKIRKYRKLKEDRLPSLELDTFEEIENALLIHGHKLLKYYRINGVKHVDIITNRGLERAFRLNKLLSYGDSIPFSAKNPRFIYREVKEFIELNDYELLTLEEEYRTTNTALKMICNRGHEWSNNFNSFKNGVRCEKCYHQDKGKLSMLSEQNIKNTLLQKGIELIYFSEYKGYCSRVVYKCLKNENHKISEDNFSNINQRFSGCLECALELKTGENSPRWKGGITNLVQWSRGRINSWKIDSLKNANYKCEITGETDNLIVHHHYPFHKILKETMEELNLDIYTDIDKYTILELESIKKSLINKHYYYGLGKVIKEDIHNEFHSEYGKVDFNESDFYEFKNNKLNNTRDKEVV